MGFIVKGGSGALTINNSHIFTDTATRDSYFLSHPAEKVEGVFISVGEGFQQFINSTWIDKTDVIQGPKGDKGVPGNSGNITTYTVGAGGIKAYQVVFISASNTILAANSDNPTHAGRVIGMAMMDGLVGELVSVQKASTITNPSWGLVAGSIYYLTAGGNISSTPPTVGFVQKIGVAENESTLLLQIEAPTILS